MRDYIIRRLLLAIPTLLLMSILVFLMVRLIPSDAVAALAARLSVAGVPVDIGEAKAEIVQRLGLDVPIHVQYGRWIGVLPGADGSFSGLLQGDLGKSFWRPEDVFGVIARRWPVTLQLGLMALIISQLIALPIGIYSALRQDSWGDYIGRSFAILCIAVPSFWLGTLVIVFPSIWWGYMHPIMHVPFIEDPLRNLRRFLPPAFILGMVMAGSIMRMTRAMMLEVLRQDYIRTAWAKGLRERIVVIRHALKNALIPVITIIGFAMPVLIGGTAILEQIFVLPGIGSLIVEASQDRDYPMVSGVMLFFGFGMVLINLMVDLAYAYLDPRVRYK